MVRVDGQYIGKQVFRASYGTNGIAHLVTPYMTNGEHTVRVFWDNAFDGTSLEVHELTLQRIGGTDSNSNNCPDWLDTRLANMCTLETTSGSSYISPVCVEGKGRFLGMMSASGGTVVKHGAGHRWYGDVGLSQTSSTQVVISFQDGLHSVSNSIAWDALNLLAETTSSEVFVRENDAMKLTAYPNAATNGTVTIEVVGVTSYVTDVSSPAIHTFASDGAYDIRGTYDDGTTSISATVTVEVVGGSFPTNTPACWYGHGRTWTVPDMSDKAEFEAHPDLSVSRSGSTTLQMSISGSDDNYYIVARAGEGGPILANSQVLLTWLINSPRGYVSAVEELEDGSWVVEDNIVVGYLPSDVDIKAALSSGGAVFEDDGTIVKWLGRDDLTKLGEYTVRILIPDAWGSMTCHTWSMYQDGVRIGWQ